MIGRGEVPNEGSCRVKCYMEPNCVSINMGPLKGGKLDCELNDVTGENDFVSALKNKADYTHLAIEVRRLIPNLFNKEILYQGMLGFWVKTLLE